MSKNVKINEKNSVKVIEEFYEAMERDTDMLNFDLKYGRLYLDYLEECLIFVDELNEDYAFMDVLNHKMLYDADAKEKIINKNINIKED